MSDYKSPPESVTWDLPKPVTFGSATYDTVTLRAPTAEDVLKATAVPGEKNLAVTLRLISAVSTEQVPFQALIKLPSWIINQMSDYMNSFDGAPLPLPLQPAPPADPPTTAPAA